MSDPFHLICGDCLDPVTGLASLADRSVDHVITDPPFSDRVHARLGREGRNDGTKPRETLSFEALTPEVAALISQQVVRVCRRWVLVLCDELSFGVWVAALESAGCAYVRKGTWVKEDPMPQMTGDRPSTGTEEIVIAHAPRPRGERMRWNGGGRPAVYIANPQERDVQRLHPAQKPIALMSAVIRDFTDPGDVVCDPFAGVASTLVAAKREGRGAIGWERDPAYHAAAVKRLANTREQPSLFAPADPMPKRAKTEAFDFSPTPEDA